MMRKALFICCILLLQSGFIFVSANTPETIIVDKGEMVFTPPMIDHAMKFPVDTVFLTLSRNPRDQETYEADVVRVDFVPSKGFKSWVPEDD